MVLRCSLLGHDYGEAEVDREREERGSEVVVTVTEYEECSRCGDHHVISENTEVTSLSSETAASAPTPPDTETAPEPTTETSADAASADDAASEPTADDTTAAAPGTEEDDDLELPTDENGEPITDDGEILEETAEPERNRSHGEWPDSEDVGPPVGADEEPADWPDDGPAGADESTTDEGSTADPGKYEPAPEEGAEVLDSSADAEFIDADADDDGHPAASSEPDTGIASARSAPLPGESDPRDGVPTEFFCPQCSFLAPGDRGSLRPGDICPECRKGYLSERERQSLR